MGMALNISTGSNFDFLIHELTLELSRLLRHIVSSVLKINALTDLIDVYFYISRRPCGSAAVASLICAIS